MKLLLLIAGAAISLFLWSGQGDCASSRLDAFHSLPGPELFYPVTENIDLSGREFLEFKWRITEPVVTELYIFKLYKGYNTVDSTLIRRLEVRIRDYPVRIPVKDLEAGQVYTWSLQQVVFTGFKSDRSYGTFKIVAK